MSEPRKKRTATSQLNHDNWDQEEEAEEAGKFKAASETAIKERKVISGKRRLARGPIHGDEGPKLFAGFAGFGSKPATGFGSSVSPLGKPASPPQPPAAKKAPPPTGPDAFKAAAASFMADKGLPARAPFQSPVTELPPQVHKLPVETPKTNGHHGKPPPATASPHSAFLKELRGLNVKFVKQLGAWLEENAHVDLSPAFADYSKYLGDLERRHGEKGDGASLAPSQASDKTPDAAKDFFGFGAAKAAEKTPASKGSSPLKGFSFGASKPLEVTPAAKATTSPLSGFSFGGPKAPEPTKPTKADSGMSFGFGAPKGKDKETPDESSKPFSSGLLASPVKAAGPPAKGDKTPDVGGGPKHMGGFSFGAPPKDADTAAKTLSFPAPGAFAFGKPKEASSAGETAPKPLAFPAPAASGGFSFGLAKAGDTPKGLQGFSFGAAAAPPASKDQDEEEGEYVPPVVEEKAAEEPDAYHSVRAKLFHQKDGKFAQGAVGNLFLKALDGAKVQLLMRADTSLGNILLNAAVTSETPLSVKKNNVSLFTVPSPLPPGPKDESQEDKDKRAKVPVAMLIRVKTEDEAQKLLDEINAKF